MASISLGDHFEKFVRKQISKGRYQNVSEIVRAGLRMLEDYEVIRQERVRSLKAGINDAWDDPGSSRPAADVFDRLEALHADTVAASSKTRASSCLSSCRGSRSHWALSLHRWAKR